MQSDLERFAGLPEVVLRATGQVLNRRPRLLTPVFGPLQRAFSGTSWYFSQAAMLDSVLDGAFVLNSKYDLNLRQAGALWKLRRLFEGKKVGGFKFSPRFHDIAWADNIRPLADTVIINNAQIYSGNFIQQHARLNITPCFYIDGTLTEYFHGYSEFEGQTYGADVVQRAIELERESYACAERVIAMSRATVRNLVEVYGVSPDRVAMVMPAANLEDKVVPPPSEHQGWVGNEFTVGFVGLYPLRKGLDKLAKATQMLRGRGLPIRLRVIGRCPSDIAAMDGVEFMGAIDKLTDVARFISVLRTVDLGCQLSRAELTGIAMMEFLRVGVPIMATNIGGMPDVVEGGGGVLVPATITAEELAEELLGVMEDQVGYNALRQAAIRRSKWASWRRAAGEIGAVLAGIAS